RLGFWKALNAQSLYKTQYNETWAEPHVRLAGLPQTETALAQIVGLVVRDFVHGWFRGISADPSFPRCVQTQIVQCSEGIVERARGLDVAEFLVGQVVPIATRHLKALRQKTSKWHAAAEGKRQVMAHMRRVVDLVVPLVLPVDQASFLPHRVLVRELLVGALLAPIVMSLAEPDTLNQLLDGQLARLIREQHMVSELREALEMQADEHVATYQEFMETIEACGDANELVRIHEDVVAQIRKKRILIMGLGKDDIVHGERVRDILVYVNRLYVAKKKAERRLELLRKDAPPALGTPNPRMSTYYAHRDEPETLGLPQFTLREILTNVSSLSAFAEHLDPSSRALLEFWLNIEGVKSQPTSAVMGVLWKTYFTRRADELAALGPETAAAVSDVQKYLKPWRAPGEMALGEVPEQECREAFRMISEVQGQVFSYLKQKELPSFLHGPLYKRFLRSYVVTPRQEQVDGALFAERPEIPEIPEMPEIPEIPERRRSVAESVGSAGRSETSSRRMSERWSFAPAKPCPAPMAVETAAAVVVHRNESASSIMHMEPAIDLPNDSSGSVPEEPPPADHPGEPSEYLQPVRRRVDRSEVRRLSASLRSISLHDAGKVDSALAEPLEPLLSDSEEEEEEEATSETDSDPSSLVLARALTNPAPGDLFLDLRLTQLTEALARKAHQMAIVKALMKQAMTRHKPHEQRILQASYRDLRRELLAGVEQQKLYEMCLREHTLSERTLLHIPRAMATDDAEPHTVYLIELQQTQDSHALAGWVVARRYREFHALHRELKLQEPQEMRRHDLPARAPLPWLQKKDVEQRRLLLERYLSGLLRVPRLCQTHALKLFLSALPPPDNEQPLGWMARIHATVNQDLEGITGAESMLDMIVKELAGQVTMQSARPEEPALFTDPLSDVFVELFGLASRRNWLRKQAISILLRHILGGTVERRVRDATQSLLKDQLLSGLLENLRATLWPDNGSGGFLHFQGFKQRTELQKKECRESARTQMLWYVPRLLGAMVGRKNAVTGATRLVDAVQQPKANLSLALMLFDAVVVAVFPEIRYQMEQ
ncbi:tRNA (guanine-N(7)-)-methyltransferase (tRNA(m7G46)-methyltransferase), partial [Linderina pennispora]